MPLTVGGQAVIEGVMLRSPMAVAVSVRKADGSIKTKVDMIKQPSQRFFLFRWPFFRGVATLWDSMSLGIKCLNFSAQEAMRDEASDTGKKKTAMPLILSTLAALFFGVVLFVGLPYLFSELLGNSLKAVGENDWLFNLVDGGFRLIIFLLYIIVISLFPDIRRVFEYHGAEHRVVHAFETGEKVTVESAQKRSVLHRRCGTSFLLILLILVIVLFSLVPRGDGLQDKIFMRLTFLPLVLLVASGTSYELLRLSAKAGDSLVAWALTAPGLALQRLVTKNPSDEQVEVAIATLDGVLKAERELSNERLGISDK